MEDKIILKFKTKNILNFYEIEPRFITEGVNILYSSAKWAYLLEIHTHPVQDVSKLFHGGGGGGGWNSNGGAQWSDLIFHQQQNYGALNHLEKVLYHYHFYYPSQRNCVCMR